MNEEDADDKWNEETRTEPDDDAKLDGDADGPVGLLDTLRLGKGADVSVTERLAEDWDDAEGRARLGWIEAVDAFPEDSDGCTVNDDGVGVPASRD